MNLLANWSEASADAGNFPGFRTLQPASAGYETGCLHKFMSGDEQDRVPEAYQERWERMVAVKTHYDPNNFFRLNQNVPPRKLALS